MKKRNIGFLFFLLFCSAVGNCAESDGIDQNPEYMIPAPAPEKKAAAEVKPLELTEAESDWDEDEKPVKASSRPQPALGPRRTVQKQNLPEKREISREALTWEGILKRWEERQNPVPTRLLDSPITNFRPRTHGRAGKRSRNSRSRSRNTVTKSCCSGSTITVSCGQK